MIFEDIVVDLQKLLCGRQTTIGRMVTIKHKIISFDSLNLTAETCSQELCLRSLKSGTSPLCRYNYNASIGGRSQEEICVNTYIIYYQYIIHVIFIS